MTPERQRMIRDALDAQPEGTFHLSEAVGARWNDLSIGEKVRLGNAVLRGVRAGAFPGIEDTGRKTRGGRLYRKQASGRTT
ncbi:DUF1413 domain-containing protein [Celeribacter indicus]|uniref:Uncharacterized protein n=1 Tax=Celeribacter indicus TaxID=1208324 RepID=A0A0B5DWM4_9RHOB|nr:DUF1413 domain-containing protein [Celeribacter indicus]AJE45535.1 hypothetical protein P73_0820 [Celeribacter indicus]SDW86579.1 protein of unknown function [Celeribacter indicus]